MNKQQLASKIWESADEMRSGSVEASKYKDYILGLLFYKFLSDKEVAYLLKIDWEKEELNELTEDNQEWVEHLQNNIGYFICFDNLYSTWIKLGNDFSVSNVTDALNAFNRNIGNNYKKIFSDIFNTLQSGISDLGNTPIEQTKALRELINLIDEIPTDNSQGYDVLGFIYEYLISNFAANAGKKAGEFYTPHEVSVLMSEIVSYHLRDKDKISIFDPTSGSGSLLINIGKTISKHGRDKESIDYFAQEKIKATYNLTRMNLIMRGISPDNITVRNGDTLDVDWPYFDDNEPDTTYRFLPVDAVVSNPPYSLKWKPHEDSRFSEYGIAPKAKADYAFVLHDLYHIKDDGIVTVVLPHGILFRVGEEGTIRKNLIENNRIDTIIGLPANIFFGTEISTIIMVLKKNRTDTDILFIDASKNYIKDGKKNKLRACDIKKITDAFIERKTVNKFSRLVSKSEIIRNEYNLNIPRYVDSSEEVEQWDIYASMFGGVPNTELEIFKEYWSSFPSLKTELFDIHNEEYCNVKVKNIKETIFNNQDVKLFFSKFSKAFEDFEEYLYSELIEKFDSVPVNKEEENICRNIFERLENIKLIDKYEVYQKLADVYSDIATDLEMLQTEGFEATRIVEPNMVIKKKDGEKVVVQEGWVGRIIPFDLVQKEILTEQTFELKTLENRLQEISSEYDTILESLSDEDGKEDVTNDDNTAFDSKAVSSKLKEIYTEIESTEIELLKQYLVLLSNKAKKREKINFINNNDSVQWDNIKPNKDGTYGKDNVNKYILELQKSYIFEEDSFENEIITVNGLMEEEKSLKSLIKIKRSELDILTKDTIHSLSEDDAKHLLKLKWIDTLVKEIISVPEKIINSLSNKVDKLCCKYQTTYNEIEEDIKSTEKSLTELLGELTGSVYDMEGIEELAKLLGVDNYE